MFIRSKSCVIGEFMKEHCIRANAVQIIFVCRATRALGAERHAEHFNLQAIDVFADSFVLDSVVLISITVDHHCALRIFSKRRFVYLLDFVKGCVVISRRIIDNHLINSFLEFDLYIGAAVVF